MVLILEEFAPARAAEIITSAEEKEETELPGPPAAMVNKVEESAANSPEARPDEPQKIELIKAPKVELTGLKVLGKIELPEPKKKEPSPLPNTAGENNGTEPPAKARPEYRKAQPRRERSFQSDKNPIALQREREAREAEKRRQEERERQKQKRTEYYQKRVKAAPPTKRVRMVDEPLEELSAAELAEPPKTWWGKFMRWLNT